MSSRDSELPGLSRGLVILATIAALPAVAGCQIAMEVPRGFLVTDRGLSSFKAVSTDDGRIWVREFSDSNQGDLAFWSQVLKNDLVKNRGYTLVEEGKAKDGAGHEGFELLFEVTAGGEVQRYLVDLFVLEGSLSNTLVTVEFVAPKDVFSREIAGVRKAIETLEP